MTAMMAFFLLMWLLGATTEKQRKALADYFTPTLVDMKSASAGADGMFGGDSISGKENYPTTGGQGNLAITIPRDASGTKDDPVIDTDASDALRASLRSDRGEEAPFFDRGPGYAALAGGSAASEYDYV